MAREQKVRWLDDGQLPGRVSPCSLCRAPIVFARTAASPRRLGGSAMPLDVMPNPDGNVAVRLQLGRSLVARVLGKDETHDRHAEVLAMPHFATCAARRVGDEAEAWLASQTKGHDS